MYNNKHTKTLAIIKIVQQQTYPLRLISDYFLSDYNGHPDRTARDSTMITTVQQKSYLL